MTINITIYNEFVHEKKNDFVAKIYPDGIHGAIAAGMKNEADFNITVATLDMPEHGLSEAVLNNTDVLMWWGHVAHGQVDDAVVDRVQARVLDGMGLVVMHSGHYSKIFKRLMGTSCGLRWREANEKERLWVINPNHPITQGIGPYIEIPMAEMYGEQFDIPDPDELLFVSWFEGGDVFRSGCCWHRGKGRIFYFRPGHETHPIFHHPQVQRVLINGVRWATFSGNTETLGVGGCFNVPEPLEPIADKGVDVGEIEHPDEFTNA